MTQKREPDTWQNVYPSKWYGDGPHCQEWHFRKPNKREADKAADIERIGIWRIYWKKP